MQAIAQLAAALALVLFLCSCEPLNRALGLSDDNIFEELAEDAIEFESGFDIDLTPTSPEKH